MNRTYPNYAKSIPELLGTTRKCVREIELYAQQLISFKNLLISYNDDGVQTHDLRIQLLLLKLNDLQKRNTILRTKQLTILNDLKASATDDTESRNAIFLNVAHLKLKTEALVFLQLFCLVEKEIREFESNKTQLYTKNLSAVA